ncbi:MAG: hypothetical protein ACJ71T_11395 [Actinomycetales bacterium]
MDEQSAPRDPRGGTDGEQPDLWLVDRLMSGVELPGGTPDRERVRMQGLVDALRAPAAPAELGQREAYLAAFDQVSTPHGVPVRTVVIGARAAAVAGIVVLAAATGAAAYTGSLPGPLQRAAHSVIGAPAEGDQGSDEATDGPSGTPTGSPTGTSTESPTATSTKTNGVGPDATGPAAFGLCNAWSHGGLATTSVSYRNLAAAAGGADGIKAYCATVPTPGRGSTHGSGSPTSHPGHGSPTPPKGHGSPTSHPSKADHPQGSPTTHPGGH